MVVSETLHIRNICSNSIHYVSRSCLTLNIKSIHARAANFILCFHWREIEKRKYLSTLPSCKGNRRQARENFTPGLLQNYVSVYYRVTSHPSGINRANILLATVYSFINFFMRQLGKKSSNCLW